MKASLGVTGAPSFVVRPRSATMYRVPSRRSTAGRTMSERSSSCFADRSISAKQGIRFATPSATSNIRMRESSARVSAMRSSPGRSLPSRSAKKVTAGAPTPKPSRRSYGFGSTWTPLLVAGRVVGPNASL
jgi:hypothetical protein